MSKIRNLVEVRAQAGEVGVEIEIEGEGYYWEAQGDQVWKATRDGSLRGNAVEYVLRRPLPVKNIDKELERLYTTLKLRYKVKPSIRCGVHIHMNVQELELHEVISFASCYYILENLLTEWCGPNRVGNHFCLRAKDADFVINHVANLLRNKDLYSLDTDNIRYSALNFKAIPRYGSLEFRALQTPSSPERISKWINILHNIFKHSLTYKNPEDIIMDFSNLTPVEWAQKALGDCAEEILFKNGKGGLLNNMDYLQIQLYEGMRFAQDLIYFSKEA